MIFPLKFLHFRCFLRVNLGALGRVKKLEADVMQFFPMYIAHTPTTIEDKNVLQHVKTPLQLT